MNSLKFAFYIFLFSVLLSCHKFIIVDKANVIRKKEGILVFIDDESKKFRNTNGDVFNDSLITDFFIPYNFSNKKIITKDDIDILFKNTKEKDIFFSYIKDDCKTGEKKIGVQASTEIFLDKNIDDYLQSNKLLILPVEIQYLKIKDNLGTDYYRLHKLDNLQIVYKSNKIKLILHSDYYDILGFKILEFNWKK